MKPLSPRRGFTLIEILLALAVGGFLLTYASFYVVSLANIWLNRGDTDFFQQHVDGVALFLNSSFARSENLGTADPDPVVWDRPPGFSEFDKPLLTFHLKETPPLLVWENKPLPGITAYLFFKEREGLSLLWYSRLMEVEDIGDVRRTLVSPFINKISYSYYDEESDRWDTENKPKEDDDDQFILPDFIKLQFQHEDEKRTVAVYVPKRGRNVPLY